MSRTLIGTVVSNKMEKSAVVAVSSSKIHPIYRKRYKTTKRFIVHDEANTSQIGDKVEISETRPMSAKKRFAISNVLQAAPVVEIAKDDKETTK